jgi:hypothetical protein
MLLRIPKREGEEKMNKKQFCFVMALALFAGLIGGALSSKSTQGKEVFAQKLAKHRKVIEAEAFRLLGKNGERVALLSVKEETGQAALAFYDNEGNERFVLGINFDKQPGMALFDKKGTINLALGIPEDGNANLSIYNGEGNQTLGIVHGGIYLIADDGTTRAFLGRDRLHLIDGKGRLRAALGSLEAKKEKAAPVGKRDISSLVLLDEKENVVWSAP